MRPLRIRAAAARRSSSSRNSEPPFHFGHPVRDDDHDQQDQRLTTKAPDCPKKRGNSKGSNPLAQVTISTKLGPKNLSSVAKTYDPPYVQSRNVYSFIEANIEAWIEEAIEIRKAN